MGAEWASEPGDEVCMSRQGAERADHTEHEALREIFLTPRVIDRRSFDEFSATLRELIARADDERRELARAASSAGELREAAGSAARELRQSLEQTLRAAESFDERLSVAEQLLAQTRGSEEAIERLREAGERLVRDRVEELERRVEEEIARAHSRLQHEERTLQSHLDEGERRIRALEDRLAERLDAIEQERIERIERLGESMRQRLAEAEERARELEQGFEERLKTLESERAEKFIRLFDAIEARLEEGQSRLVEFDASMEERFARARDEQQALVSELESQRIGLMEAVEQARAVAREADEELAQRVLNSTRTELEAALEEGEARVASLIAHVDQVMDRLRDVEDQATPAVQAGEYAMKMLATLRAAAEQARLDPAVLAKAAEQAARLEDLVAYLGSAPALIRQVHEEAQAAGKRLEELRREMEQIAPAEVVDEARQGNPETAAPISADVAIKPVRQRPADTPEHILGDGSGGEDEQRPRLRRGA